MTKEKVGVGQKVGVDEKAGMGEKEGVSEKVCEGGDGRRSRFQWGKGRPGIKEGGWCAGLVWHVYIGFRF